MHCSQIRSEGQTTDIWLCFYFTQTKLLALLDLGIWAHTEEDEKENGELEIASGCSKGKILLVLYREHLVGVKEHRFVQNPPTNFLLCLKVCVID